MQIRAATPPDLSVLEKLFAEVDAHHRVLLPERFRAPDGPVRTEQHLLGLVTSSDSAVLLADDDGDAVGFATVVVRDTPPVPVFVPGRVGVVDTLGVAARARRRGVGRMLMAAAEAWLRERGARDLELTVYEVNADAIAFYESLGYRLLSRRMARTL